MGWLKVFTLSLILALSSCLPAMAEDKDDLKTEIEELRVEIEDLREQVESSGAYPGEAVPAPFENVTLGGYGELHYNDFSNSTKASTVDFHRFVLFFAYEFNDWIKFDSEVEIEHALSGDGAPGEVELEQAFVDFHISERVNVRAGLMLIPLGIINETHEPPSFYGVERPDVDKLIVPTTWWEAGAGVYGRLGRGVGYKLYLVSTPDASGFTASSGIRSGRQKVAKAKAEDFGVAGRLEYTDVPGLKLGGSFFTGSTGQGDPAIGDAALRILEADVQYTYASFDLRALYATIDLDDADAIKAATGEDVGEKMFGWYVEAAWRFLGHLKPGSDHEMAVFARYSHYDTQDELPTGSAASGANDVEVVTVGLDYKPAPNVVVKLDWQDRSNNDPLTEAADQFNLGLGYAF